MQSLLVLARLIISMFSDIILVYVIYLGDRRGYSHLKEESLDRIKWRNRFGRGCGPVV
jgi:hypothetical protein